MIIKLLGMWTTDIRYDIRMIDLSYRVGKF